jgi:hypothetical protein
MEGGVEALAVGKVPHAKGRGTEAQSHTHAESHAHFTFGLPRDAAAGCRGTGRMRASSSMPGDTIFFDKHQYLAHRWPGTESGIFFRFQNFAPELPGRF